jgi:phosphatidylserine/phosphatidylglycerophosphate/cardiolipin synthase-like enzyme
MASPDKKSKTGITLVVLGVIVVLGLYFVLTGSDPLGLFTELKQTVVTPVAPVSPGPSATPTLAGPSGQIPDWSEVYFTFPDLVKDPADWQGSIEGRLIDKITAAESSIHIASFEFDLTPVAEALIAAEKRGVDVRWVTDDESGLQADKDPDRGQFALLKKAGIEVRDDGRTALMHDKFWIFDGRIVWTGSTNITASGIFKQNNNTIVIRSPELAAIYEREFGEMWAGNFGPTSPSTASQQFITLEGTPIQVLFASEDHALDAIIPKVKEAATSIRFLAFSFTADPLGQAIIDRAKKGVDVAGVFEKVGSDTEFSELAPLYCAKIPVRQDGNPSFLHHKVIVIDARTVITGSLNFSANADESNDENVVIIDNADIARLYLQEFDRLWAEGTDPVAAKMACE